MGHSAVQHQQKQNAEPESDRRPEPNDHCPSWADCSSAGMSKLYTVATTITPAAKLIRAFCRLMFMVSRTKNKQAAPRLVPAKGMSSPVKTVASISCN